MSKAKLTLLNSVLFLLPFWIHAQDNLPVASDTLVWHATTLTDNATGHQDSNTSEFVTFGSSKIRWKQSGNGQPIFEFSITAVEDHWLSGRYIIFSTTRKSKTQTFRFEQTGSSTKVIFTFNQLDQNRTLVFDIDLISTFQD
ncbi:MAG: hypothetical protein U0U09_18145 [Cyclobacteriaceae bacterium]